MNKIDTGIAELLAKQPSDSAEKDAYIAELQKTVRLLTDEVRNMDELLALLRKKQFAPSSEQTKPTEEQLGLFNEAEQENKPEPKEPIKKDARGYHTDGYSAHIRLVPPAMCSSSTGKLCKYHPFSPHISGCFATNLRYVECENWTFFDYATLRLFVE